MSCSTFSYKFCLVLTGLHWSWNRRVLKFQHFSIQFWKFWKIIKGVDHFAFVCVCMFGGGGGLGGRGVGEEENPASPQTMFDKLYLTLSAPASLINIHLLLTISVQNQLFCCENMGIDHTLQAIQYEKLNAHKLLKGKYIYHLGEFRNTSFVVFGAERVNTPPFGWKE